MKTGKKDLGPGLPVDPARLRARFPSLTDEDVEAYVAVTRRILAQGDPGRRAKVTREVLERARRAREAGPKDDDDRAALRYLDAVEKMQDR